MPALQAILNQLKWTKDFTKVEIWYRHRGAHRNIKIISGTDIYSIKKTYFETKTTTIPYHRILKILYNGEILFDRSQL